MWLFRSLAAIFLSGFSYSFAAVIVVAGLLSRHYAATFS